MSDALQTILRANVGSRGRKRKVSHAPMKLVALAIVAMDDKTWIKCFEIAEATGISHWHVREVIAALREQDLIEWSQHGSRGIKVKLKLENWEARA